MASSESPDGTEFTRPQHPDVDLLAVVVERHLRPREGVSMDEALRMALGSLVDPPSGSWAGVQRAIGFLGITTPEELQRRHLEVFRLGVFWLDGFIAGGHLERLRSEPEG
jgi:hypothetical protein